jgi:hypothetical protein
MHPVFETFIIANVIKKIIDNKNKLVSNNIFLINLYLIKIYKIIKNNKI